MSRLDLARRAPFGRVWPISTILTGPDPVGTPDLTVPINDAARDTAAGHQPSADVIGEPEALTAEQEGSRHD